MCGWCEVSGEATHAAARASRSSPPKTPPPPLTPSPLSPFVLLPQTRFRTTACRGPAPPRCRRAGWATGWRGRASPLKSWWVGTLRLFLGSALLCLAAESAHVGVRFLPAQLPAYTHPCLPPAGLQDEEEEEGQGLLGWHPQQRQEQYALPGRAAPLMLQSRVRLGCSAPPALVPSALPYTFA